MVARLSLALATLLALTRAMPLLVWHRAAAEDRLEVHPLALDRVELREGGVEHRQLGRVLRRHLEKGAEQPAELAAVDVHKERARDAQVQQDREARQQQAVDDLRHEHHGDRVRPAR